MIVANVGEVEIAGKYRRLLHLRISGRPLENQEGAGVFPVVYTHFLFPTVSDVNHFFHQLYHIFYLFHSEPIMIFFFTTRPAKRESDNMCQTRNKSENM